MRTTALSEYCFRLKESGYTAKERLAIIQEGTKAYQNQVQREADGVCPLYRPKEYQREKRVKKKEMSKVAWYRPHNTVLFIPPTPGSELKRSLQTIADRFEEDSGTKIRIVERAGQKIKHILPGLNSSNLCTEQHCFLHSSGGKGNHDSESIVYRGECITCAESGPSSKPKPRKKWTKDGDNTREIELIAEADRKPGTRSIYFGESGRSILVRGKQHITAMENPHHHTDNAFSKHAIEYHAGEMPKYKVSVVGKFPKPLQRQVWEGVMIHRCEKKGDCILMNSKLDHYAPAVGRVVISNTVNDA